MKSRPSSKLDDRENVEVFTLDRARWSRGRLTPTSAFKLQTLAAYPQLYEEINRAESGEYSATPTDDGRATRILNVVVALVGLILTLPLFILIAFAVKCTSRGKVFYSQTRVGLDRRWMEVNAYHEARVADMGGRPFRMYKFRTMVTDAEGDGGAVWATRNDPRVTRVGRVLRATRLDELPQLINVLVGDMNVVGPRPERPSIFEELRNQIPGYHLRQRVMPGITGWAQVNQGYDTTVDDVRRKVDLDMEYVRQRSLARDLEIMARTIPVMVWSDLGR